MDCRNLKERKGIEKSYQILESRSIELLPITSIVEIDYCIPFCAVCMNSPSHALAPQSG